MTCTSAQIVVVDDHRLIGLGVRAAFEEWGADTPITWSPTFRDVNWRRGQIAVLDLRACQFFCVWGLEVGGDSVGVGGGELGEGLFPVGGGVSLDEAGVSCSFVGGFASVCEALGGAFVFDVADGEP